MKEQRNGTNAPVPDSIRYNVVALSFPDGSFDAVRADRVIRHPYHARNFRGEGRIPDMFICRGSEFRYRTPQRGREKAVRKHSESREAPFSYLYLPGENPG